MSEHDDTGTVLDGNVVLSGRWYWNSTLEQPMLALFETSVGDGTWMVLTPGGDIGQPIQLVWNVMPNAAFDQQLGDNERTR